MNHHHCATQFYRDTISTDRQRIHDLFARATDNGIRVVPIILHLDDIRRFLVSGNYVVIVLVDLARLTCLVCSKRGIRRFSKGVKEWWKRRRWSTAQAPELYIREEKTNETLNRGGGDDGNANVNRVDDGGGMVNRGGRDERISDVARDAAKGTLRASSFFSRFFCCASRSPPQTQGAYGILPRRSSVSTASSTTLIAPTRSTPSSSPQRSTTPPPASQEAENFVGHYVLLVGYDADRDLFLYRDPGSGEEVCAVDGEGIEKARSCVGTDHDCIVARVR